MPYILNLTVEFDTEDEKEAKRRAYILCEEIMDDSFVVALAADPVEPGKISA
jgi:hypothetical protein